MDVGASIVSAVFILTTFGAIAFLLHAVKLSGMDDLPAKILVFVLPLWIIFQAVLAIGGFYLDESSVPPRLFLVGVLPSLLLIAFYFFVFRGFIDRLSIRTLTIIHIVRIPVEIVLYWLSAAGLVPVMMTFQGLNFDILSGIAAPLAYWLAFRGRTVNRLVLVIFNIFGLILLLNIVSIAILSLPTPLQQLNFDHPNQAVLLFPYVWLPTIVVPIVLFAHIVSFRRLFATGDD